MRPAPDATPTTPRTRTKRSHSGKFSETMLVTPHASERAVFRNMSGILTFNGLCKILRPTRCESKQDYHRLAKRRVGQIPTTTSWLGFAAVVQQSAAALWRMGAKCVFVGLGAPAGPVRDDEIAVFEVGHMDEKLVVPCQPVDVGLHDPQVRHRRA